MREERNDGEGKRVSKVYRLADEVEGVETEVVDDDGDAAAFTVGLFLECFFRLGGEECRRLEGGPWMRNSVCQPRHRRDGYGGKQDKADERAPR